MSDISLDSAQLRAHEALNNPDFKKLAQRKNSVSAALTIAMLLVYYGFITLLAYDKDLLGHKISTHTTLGMPIGIGVILLSWLLTGVYVRWANREYDALVAQVRAELQADTR